MADKGKEPMKDMSIFDRLRFGELKRIIVPVKHEESDAPTKPEKSLKRGQYRDHSHKFGGHARWTQHAEMLEMHKEIKRRRRRTELAKKSRREQWHRA